MMSRSATQPLRSFTTTTILVGMFVCAMASAAAVEGTIVSSRSSSASTPRIAATAGGDCAVVWHESRTLTPKAKEQPLVTIMAQRRLDGAWSKRHALAPLRNHIAVRHPAATMDSSGNPHVVWAAQQGDISYLEYAFAIGARWLPAEQIGEISTEKIEHPVLAVRPGGNPDKPSDEIFFAWQERRGTNYRIHTLVIDASGEARSQVLAHTHVSPNGNAMREVTYPQLMLLSPVSWSQGPRMAICWYQLHADRAELEMRIWHPARRAWQPFKTPALNPNALNSLPLVQATPDTGPFLIGYSAARTSDRIFFTSANFPLAWIDNSPQSFNRMPRISQPIGGIVGLVWQSANRDGTTLKQALLDPKGKIAIRSLSSVDTFLAPQADVAISKKSILTVWIAPTKTPSNSLAGVPAVHFADTPVPQPAWQPINPIRNITP